MKNLIVFLSITVFLKANSQIIITVAGGGTSGLGDGGQATSASLYGPQQIAFDAAGNLYIADQLNSRIRKVNSAGVITTVVGNGTPGYSGDGGPATSAMLNYPWGITFDKAGNMYIGDNNNNVVRKVNTSGIISTYAGNQAGGGGYSGNGGPATLANLSQPAGLVCDTIGNLYIADWNNNVVRVVNTSGIINAFAGNHSASYSGDGGQATLASLNSPTRLAIDLAGNIYISDLNNSRIRKVNTVGIITTVAGNGTSGFGGDGGLAISANINYPDGVAVDLAGNLYIADQFNYRIRKVSQAGIITTVAGNGTAGFSGDGGLATAAKMDRSSDVACDSAGNIFFSDYSNYRIRSISKPLTITVNSDTVCAGATTDTLTASGAAAYTWSTAATTDTIIVTPITTTSYTISGTTTFVAFNVSTKSTGTATATVTVNSCTSSVKQFTNKQDVIIFPIPSDNNITVQSLAELGAISIYNSLGDVVLQIKSKNLSEQIDISQFHSGVYTIQVQGKYIKLIKK